MRRVTWRTGSVLGALAASLLTACGPTTGSGAARHVPTATPSAVSRRVDHARARSTPVRSAPRSPTAPSGFPGALPGNRVPPAAPPAGLRLSPVLGPAASLLATAEAMGFPTSAALPPIVVVPAPTGQGVQWAFAESPWPTPLVDAPSWFGQRQPGHGWRWVPVYPQRTVPVRLPWAIREAWGLMQNLHQGGPVPAISTAGMTTAGLEQAVDWPTGWTAEPVGPALAITVWARKIIGPPGQTVWIGLMTRWTAQNAATGAESIWGWTRAIVPAGTPFAQAVGATGS